MINFAIFCRKREKNIAGLINDNFFEKLKNFFSSYNINSTMNFFFFNIYLARSSLVNFEVIHDIIAITNLLKHKIILLNYYFRFSINKRKYKYIAGRGANNKFSYYTVDKNKMFTCYFVFLKRIRKLFLFKKSYFLDSFIFKKKASVLKKYDNAKRYLLFRTKKLLNFNRSKYNNLRLRAKNKKTFFKKSLNLFFFNKTKKKSPKKYTNTSLMLLRRGFFKNLINNRKLVRTVFFFKFKKQK
jgi:hypothetical protein